VTTAGTKPTKVTFYTIANHRFFLGAVALLNSLRVTGHSGELVVLDVGLVPSERELLEDHARVVASPKPIESHPTMMKPYPHFFEPSGTVVAIDSDILVTGSLGEVFELADQGKICAYPDTPTVRNRWHAEWEQTLKLRSPLRHEVYVNAGFVVFSTTHWPQLLERWWNVCQLVPGDQAYGHETIFNAGDQDALNALLMSEISRDNVALLPEAQAAFAGDVTVEDLDTLRCSANREQKTILHYLDSPKPWEPTGWLRLAATDYVRLMRRLLFAPDVPLRLDPNQVPVWLRPTRRGELTLRALGAANRAVVWSAHRAPTPLRDRLRRVRRALA
jgi:hypothetical protein